MSIFTAIMLFIIIWWVVIFAVLPWGVKRTEEPEEGHDPGAPERPMLWRKLLITTIISFVLWGILYYLIDNGILVFREL